jgi:type IV secretory pathway protease TraF
MRQVLSLLFLCLAATGCALMQSSPLLIYNGSASAPVGFYARRAADPFVGSYVTVRASAVAPAYAAVRSFDGPRNWFIKRVAARGGARVCAHGEIVEVNTFSIRRSAKDSAGRRLPAWRGCRTLAADEYFLLGESADSFDSRYWGPVRRHMIEGVWTPLWTPRAEAQF